jgi:hypothetical protein
MAANGVANRAGEAAASVRFRTRRTTGRQTETWALAELDEAFEDVAA